MNTPKLSLTANMATSMRRALMPQNRMRFSNLKVLFERILITLAINYTQLIEILTAQPQKMPPKAVGL